MKNIWTVLCKDSSIDQDTNTLSIFNCLEEITLTLDPKSNKPDSKLSIQFPVQLVSYWFVEDSDLSDKVISVDFVNPNGDIMSSHTSNVIIKKDKQRLRTRFNVQILKITSEGRYYFNLSINKELITSTPIDIKIQYKIS